MRIGPSSRQTVHTGRLRRNRGNLPEDLPRIDDLLRAMKMVGRGLTKAELLDVETNDKRRFTLSPDGRRLRAAQGHSIDVDLGLRAVRWRKRP